MAHINDSGLQAHSVGPLYPWSIVWVGGDNFRCYGVNCVTGERTKERVCDNPSGFSQVYADVEKDIRLRRLWVNDYVSAMQDLADLGYPET